MEVASNYGRGSCQQHRRKLRHSTEDPLLAQAAAYSSSSTATTTSAAAAAAAASAGAAAAAAIVVDSDDAADNDDSDSDGEGDAPDSTDVALDRDEELLITSTFLYLMSKVRQSAAACLLCSLLTSVLTQGAQ
jgi:hypothetical protein